MTPSTFINLIEASAPVTADQARKMYEALIHNQDHATWAAGWEEVYGLIKESGSIVVKHIRHAPGSYRETPPHSEIFPSLNARRQAGFTFIPYCGVIAIGERLCRQELDFVVEDLRSKGYAPVIVWNGWSTGAGTWIPV